MPKKKTTPAPEVKTPPPEQGAQRAAVVARTMAAVGFAPRQAQGPAHIEYRKEYLDPSGKRAHVIALINRGVAGIDHARLDGFVVTLQFHLPPQEEAIERAPEDLRPDMYAITKLLGSSLDDSFATSDLTCEACGVTTAEFKLGAKNKILCPACHAKASMPEKIDI